MKKVVILISVVIVVITMSTIAYANNDPIWEHVYSWWKEAYQDTYDLFINTEYGSGGFAKNGTAYYAYYGCALFHDEAHTMKEMNEYVDTCLKEAGLKNYTFTLNCIGEDHTGRYVIETTIHTEEDLTQYEGTGFDDFSGPIHDVKMISYDRITVPERWD